MRLAPTFDRCFRKLYGKPCWNAKRGYASFITFEFGEPRLEIREPHESSAASRRVRELLARRQVTLRGDWHLWIYCCDWRVSARRKLVGGSSSDRAIQHAVAFLDGQALTEVSLNYRSCRSVFVFDLGGRLITTPCDSDSEQWMLYEPSGKVLTLRADRMFAHEASDAPPSLKVWRPAWSG
jgi:hypothetical protein